MTIDTQSAELQGLSSDQLVLVTVTASLLDKVSQVEVASDFFLISIKFEQLRPPQTSDDELLTEEATNEEESAGEEEESPADEESDPDGEEDVETEDAEVESVDEESEIDGNYAKFKGVVIDDYG